MSWLSLRAQHAGREGVAAAREVSGHIAFNQGTGGTLALFSLVQKREPIRESPDSGCVFPQPETGVQVTPNPTGLGTSHHTILKPKHIQVTSGRSLVTKHTGSTALLERWPHQKHCKALNNFNSRLGALGKPCTIPLSSFPLLQDGSQMTGLR